ncbi:MAG: FAD-binding oxidoreductase [Planctomycetota bacterium]
MSLVDPRAIAELQAQVRAGADTVDRSALDAIGEVDDSVVTVGAGVSCGAVEELAAPWLFASDRPDSTVADWIGCGCGDLLWDLLGPTRAQVLGVRAVLKDGSLVRFGGRVVKNVAGYDLTRAFVGAGNRLGFVVEATLRLRPAPRGWHAAISRDTPWHEARAAPGSAVWNGDTVLFLRAGESAPAGYQACDPDTARRALRDAWGQVRTVCALDETGGRVPQPGDVFLAGVNRIGTRAESVERTGPLWDRLEAALSGTAKR